MPTKLIKEQIQSTHLMNSDPVELPVTVLLQENDLRFGRPPLGEPRLQGQKVIARFDRGYCILSKEGEEIEKGLWVRPKSLSRPDTHTIIVDTGASNFGRLVLSFESQTQTDLAETKLKQLTVDD